MIGRADIVERVIEWRLREDVVEKDYVLGWLLWGIGQHPRLGDAWVFKGGTCLRKCYIETYRFSEDLDFTVVPGGPFHPEDVQPLLEEVLARVADESGVDLAVQAPRLRLRPGGRSTEGRVYYRGPRQSPAAASVKIDLSADESIVRPPILRSIVHPYPDALPGDATARCYPLEELFAEKIRAMAQRSRPRDLYDVVNLHRRHDLRLASALVKEILAEKCEAKAIAVPTREGIDVLPHRGELETEWENMLAHQLPGLPPIEEFLSELDTLFEWLEGAEPSVPARIGFAQDEDESWTPPPTVATWGRGVPLEAIRFAATNRLCVELGYKGRIRVIEPYSLRQSRQGNLLLHALRADDHQHRAYRVDRIESVQITARPFRPVYAVEFAAAGPLSAPPTRTRADAVTRTARPTTRRSGPVYVVECSRCGRQFRRKTRNTRMRAHKDSLGWECSGRHGRTIDTRY